MEVQVLSPAHSFFMDTNFAIELLSWYQMPALFLGAFLFGETVVLAAAFLAAQGLWSAWTVFWLALLGTLASDALWFLYGQKFLSIFHKWEMYRRGSEKFLGLLEKISGNRPFLSLVFIKAVYGARILTIIYLSVRRVRFPTFLLFDAIGSAWWLAAIVAFGQVAGSLAELVPILDKLEYAVLAIVVIIILWRIIFLWIGKTAIRELEQAEQK